jgi:hypothetical protein
MKKYDDFRHLINHGDLILFRGKKPLARIIQKLDHAYFNHVGLALYVNDRLMILDSNAPGVDMEWLSTRMEKYTDFAVLRPRENKWSKEVINNAVSAAIKRSETHIGYDFDLLIEIAVERKTGINVLNFNSENRDICSEFAYRYVNFLKPAQICYNNVPTDWITPWDYVVYRNASEFDLLLMDENIDLNDYRKI